MISRTSRSNDLEIEIEDYKFTLISFNPGAYDGRGILLLESENLKTNEKIPLCLYRSNSELFWRLCYTKSAEEIQLEKGSLDKLHYVMTTFIYIELQIFINQKMALKLIPIEDKITECFTPYNSVDGLNDKILNYIMNRKGIDIDHKDMGVFVSDLFKHYFILAQPNENNRERDKKEEFVNSLKKEHSQGVWLLW